MARYSPHSDLRERIRASINDTDSCAGVLAHALTMHRHTHGSSAVGTGAGSGPFSGRRRFGGDERGELHSKSRMERETDGGWE